MDLFKEELNVICEELNEWKDDLHQHCEDLAFYNGFNNRRIKELIIGKEEDIKNTTIEEVIEFYKKYYNPSNAVISVVTPKTFEETIEIVKSNFSNWSNNYNYNHQAKYEENIEGVFVEEREATCGAKINIGFTIHCLSQREIVALKILNYALGIGTSSILYNKLRTKKGLVYDVNTNLKNERDIKMYTITLGTSKENIYQAINGVSEALNELAIGKYSFDEKNIKRIIKALRLKKELREQSCIRASIDLTLNHLMFGDGELIEKEFEVMNEINEAEIIDISKKIFNRLTIQIISPK
jgi:predicted Zn-dependent peptidase